MALAEEPTLRSGREVLKAREALVIAHWPWRLINIGLMYLANEIVMRGTRSRACFKLCPGIAAFMSLARLQTDSKGVSQHIREWHMTRYEKEFEFLARK